LKKALVEGFSLHAATRVMASDRRGLWRLCAYGARGAVASSRLSELRDGRFAYDMKRALPDGRRQLVMTGVELLEKLVPLIPPTYANLTRFHGVFAPTSRLRDKVVPLPPSTVDGAEPPAEPHEHSLPRSFFDTDGALNGAQVVVVPFLERGTIPQELGIGASSSSALQRSLAKGLTGLLWVDAPEADRGAQGQSLVAAGKAAGGLLALGCSVADVGTDLLLEAIVVDVTTGAVRGSATAVFPKGDQATLIPVERLVLKTRNEALFRALIPGGGQYFNGPEHLGKGIAVSVGTGLGVIAGGVLLALSAQATGATKPFEPGGASFIELSCDLDAGPCVREQKALLEATSNYQLAAAGAFSLAAVAYGYGFIDAWLSGVD